MPSVNCSHAMNTFMCVCQNTKNPAFSFETSKSSSKPNCVLSEAQQKRLRIGAVFIFCRYKKYLIVTLHFIAVFMDKLFVVVNQAARYAAIQVKPNYACSKPMRLYQTEWSIPEKYFLQLWQFGTCPTRMVTSERTAVSAICRHSKWFLCSFIASNWQSGWVGALMKDVFLSLGLQDGNIEAMTQVNFSEATDPLNKVKIRTILSCSK